MVREDWSVICYDHELTFLWKTPLEHEGSPAEGGSFVIDQARKHGVCKYDQESCRCLSCSIGVIRVYQNRGEDKFGKGKVLIVPGVFGTRNRYYLCFYMYSLFPKGTTDAVLMSDIPPLCTALRRPKPTWLIGA